MTVIEHRAVGNAFMRIGKMLQVLIVGRNDAPGLFLAELSQHTFGDGPAYLRFRSGTKLVNQDQRAVVG